MESGVHQLSNNDYHSSEGISKSGLDKMNISPAHYEYWRDNRDVDSSAEHFVLGSALHSRVLEPDLFYKQYVKGIKVDKRTKVGKQAWAEFLVSAGDKTVLSPDQFDDIEKMTIEIYRHTEANSILDSAGNAEQSVYWVDDVTGVLCKCRPDWWRNDGIIVDVKTSISAAPSFFKKSIGQYRYHVQAAFYSDGCKTVTEDQPSHFVFIVVEKTPPYAVAVYSLSGDSIKRGRQAYQDNLITYAECLVSKQFYGFRDYNIIDAPVWA